MSAYHIHCRQCAPAFLTTASHVSSLSSEMRATLSIQNYHRQRWRAARSLRRVRMSIPPPDSPGDLPEDSTNKPKPHFNLDVLRRRISDLDERQKAGYSASDSVDNISSNENENDMESVQLIRDFENLRNVWVIVFTNANDNSEGIYSLSIADENIVLAFQDKEEAQRYAMCLEQQEFPSPKITDLETKELSDFCTESDFRLGFVPKGSLISPPEESAIDDLDKWRGDHSASDSKGDVGMTQEEIELMKKKLDSLFGQ